MRLHPHARGVALALVVAFLGCAGEERSRGGPAGVTNAQPRSASVQDQGRDVLIEADRQMKDLERLPSSTDPFVSEAMTRQIADLRVRSDRLMDDMTIGDGRVHDIAIRADVTNLQRTMSEAANAERQAAEPETDRSPMQPWPTSPSWSSNGTPP
jgi:hypothetical protein